MAIFQKSVLVTGAGGRIGGILRTVWGSEAAIWQARTTRPGFVAWDMLTAHWEGASLEGAVIVNLAGVTTGARLDDNIALARAARDLAGREGAAHLFLLSSAAVYGRGDGEPLHEEGATHPANPYGEAKLRMEALAAGHPHVTVLRLGNVAGADALLGRAIPDVEVQLDPVPDRPGGPERSYIGPLTLARVLARLCDLAGTGATLPPVLNLAQPGSVTMAALLNAAGLPWRYGPCNPQVVPRVVLDTTRLEALMDLPPADAAAMVAEWRELQGMMRA